MPLTLFFGKILIFPKNGKQGPKIGKQPLTVTFFKRQYPTQLLKILKIWFHIWIALEMYFWIDTDHFFSNSTPSPLKMGAKLGNILKIAWLSNYYLLNHSTVFIIFCIKIEYHKTFKMMLSLFWKYARFPQKGQNGAKVQLEKNQLFCILLKIGWFDFFDISHTLRGY